MAAVAAVHSPDNNAAMAHVWGALGLTVNQINALTAEGMDSLRSFSMSMSLCHGPEIHDKSQSKQGTCLCVAHENMA